MKNFLIVILTCVGIILSTLLGGFILMKCYEWCVIPTLACFNVYAPHISYSIFLLIDVGMATLKYKPAEKGKDAKDLITDSLGLVIGKVFLLFILWIIYMIVI